MDSAGYKWAIEPSGEAWRWRILERNGEAVLDHGAAPSRAVAAAFVVRAISRGMTARTHAGAPA